MNSVPADNKVIDFDPFAGPEIISFVPSTESQLEIWMSCQLGGDDANRAFNESVSLEFNGFLVREAFEKALSALVLRHDSLRSAFSADGSKMFIYKDALHLYSYEDLSLLNEQEQENKIKAFVLADAMFVFNLSDGPLCKFGLYKLSENSYHFTITAHHIICDGWSMGIILQDLSKYYSAFVKGATPLLPEVDSFPKYAVEQAEFVRGQEYKNNIDYWVGQFSTVPVLDLPIDNVRPNNKTFKSSRYDHILNNELVTAIKKVGVKEGCSFVNTLLAAFELFLYKTTGQKELVIGLPAADQSATGQYNLVGHCVNLLPLKSTYNGQIDFPGYLKLRKSAILDAYEHQQFTFGSLLKNLKLKRDPSRVPLVPVVFNVDMEMDKDVSFEALTYKIISNSKEFRNFELSLNVWGSENALQLELSYNSYLFKRDSIVGMVNDFENLLKTIVENPNEQIENIIGNRVEVKEKIIQKELHDLSPESSFNEQDRDYWLKQFSGELPVLELPTDKIRPSVKVYKPASVTATFDKRLLNDFKIFLENNNSNIESGLLSLVNTLLYSYTGQEDFVIGCRSSFEANKNVALRNLMNGEDNFIQLLAKAKKMLLDTSTHSAYPMNVLFHDLNLHFNDYRHPLFDVAIAFGNENVFSSDGLDLVFNFNSTGEDLSINYNSELFSEDTINKCVHHLEGLLGAILKDSTLSVNQLEYLDISEKNQLLYEFNNTASDYPRTKATLVSLFEEQVHKTPDNIAIVFEGKKITYKELNEKANKLGDYLRKTYHIKADDLIGVKLERNDWLIVAIMGVLKSGGVYVPIDPDYPEERITYILEDSGCKIVVDNIMLAAFLKVEFQYSRKNPKNIINSKSLLYLIYTSGSTGKPKAVMIDHRNMLNYINWFLVKFSISDKEGTLLLSSITFDGVKTSVFGALLSGSALHIMGKEILQSPKELSGYISENHITFLKITPPLLNLLISDEGSYNTFIKSDDLRLILVGGEKINIEDIRKIKSGNKKIKVINHYGPTETTVGVTTKEITDTEAIVSIGSPINNALIYILSPKGKLLPVGVFGEICIGGEGVSRGYLNKPDLSNEKFVENPYRQGRKMYKTGDIGRWLKDGTIEFIGRKDHQVKIRGYRIELGEIENAILQHPLIEAAVVLAKEESNGENTLMAFMVSKDRLNTKDVRVFLENKLPFYMVPSFFNQIDEIPLTINGKIDRNSLLKFQIKNTEKVEIQDLPNTPEENIVASIWSDFLGIKNIGKTDDFFELGGHSLIAIKVIIRLENETGFRLPMASLFEYPTIEKIAKLITSKEGLNKWKSLVPIKPTGTKTPLYLVHGGGLGVLVFQHITKYMDADQPVYGLQALGLNGTDEPLDTIEEMASFYVSEMLEQNPNGPFALGGHSSGGLIAFEIAKQLQALGKEVRSLVIFDFDLGEIQKFHSLNEKLRRKFLNFFPILFFNIRSIIKRPEKTFKYYRLIWKLRFESMKERLGMGDQTVYKGIDLYIHNAIVKNEKAIWNYKLKPYNGHMDLLVSLEKVYYQQDAKYLGWTPYILKGIRNHDVNGDHDEMILPPNNQQFARTLQKILDDN